MNDSKKKNQYGLNINNNYIFWGVLVALGMILIYIYGFSASVAPTVWELGDEAGYLWNAAYFTHTDWDSVAGLYSYYGYGYSLFLIPLFYLLDSGVGVIGGAYIVNIIMLVGTYLLLTRLLRELSNTEDKILYPCIAFVSCLMPFVASNVHKVLCEICLLFFYTLTVLLFIYMQKRGGKYYIFFSMCAVFVFFIHTRAIVVSGVSIVALLATWWRREKKDTKWVLLSGAIAAIVFVGCYCIKLDICSYRDLLRSTLDADFQEANLITMDFILERLSWFNPKNYFLCFVAKIFYGIDASAFTIVPAVVISGKAIAENWLNDKKLSDMAWTEIYVFTSFIATIVASTMTGTGSDARFIFYGRYYEYILPVMTPIALYIIVSGMNQYLTKLDWVRCLAFFAIVGIVVMIWCSGYATDPTIKVDTLRIDAFSKAIDLIKNSRSIGTLVVYVTFLCLTVACFYYLADIIKKPYLIILVFAFYVWQSSSISYDTVHQVQGGQIPDTVIAEYVANQIEDEKVYMIDDESYRYPKFYSRMQVLLKDIVLHVIVPEDSETIEDGSYVMVYVSNELDDELDDYELIQNGTVFQLYRK